MARLGADVKIMKILLIAALATFGIFGQSITPSGNATTASPSLLCLDKTVVYSVDLVTASGTVAVTLGTFPANFVFTSVWGRETVTFAGTSMTSATVSIGPAGAETSVLPTVGLKQTTNTVSAFNPGYVASNSAVSVVAQFVITSGGGVWSGASAGTYAIRVCGVVGRP